MANIHRTPAQWQQIFEQYAVSGLQVAGFCKQQKLNTSSFYAWRKRLENHALCATDKQEVSENNQDDWVNVTQEQAIPSPNWDVELALPNGIVLRMMNR